MSLLSKAEVQYLEGQKQLSKSYERKLKCTIRKKAFGLRKHILLLTKLIPIEQILDVEVLFAVNKAKAGPQPATEISNLHQSLIRATDFSSSNVSRNTNLPTNLRKVESSIKPNDDKLYNCPDFIHQHRRVRSVVRISRRSSEPQVMGSKPTGPVIHMGSNNSWLHRRLDKRRYKIAR